MAWISVHDHVMGGKLRELSKEIGCSQEEALGILVSLWLWGLNNADKDGRLVSADKDDVLEAFSARMLSRLKVNIVESLIKTRWMDEPEAGVLYIHDWDTWQEQWFKFQSQKEYDAKRKREERARKRRHPSSEKPEKPDSPSDCHGDSPADSPPDAGKNGDDAPKEDEEKSRYSKTFEEFWKAYPRHVDKGNAYKKYMARLKDGYSEAELLAAATRYAEQCLRDHTEDRYIKHPKTFLSDALPFLDYLDKQQNVSEPDDDPGGNPFARYKRGDDDDD